MRIMVFFDLPTETLIDKREYRRFRKILSGEGFIMMQESVYCKLVLNYSACELAVERLRKQKPKKGLVQCLAITEKQYADIEYIQGVSSAKQVSSIERIIKL